MTAYTLDTYVRGGTSGVPSARGHVGIEYFEVNLADVHTAAAAAGTTLANADTIVVKLVDMPADTYFELIQAEMVTAGVGTSRLDLGDDQDDDEHISNAATLTAGTNLTITKATFTNGIVLSAADDWNLKITCDASVASMSGILRLVYLTGSAERVPLAVVPTYTNA